MTIIKLLRPFEKTLESRRFKIILYLLTSIILAPVAAYLERIGLRPVHIIWCIWLLIIPVTYVIYFVWSYVAKKEEESSVKDQLPEPDIFEPVRRLFFNNKDGIPIEPELALASSNSGDMPGSLQAEFPGIGAAIRFLFLDPFYVGAELIQLRQGQSVVLEINSKRISLSLHERRSLGKCHRLGIKADEDKWKHLEDVVSKARAGVIS
ncbi:hypothetical protein FJZ31_09595 [Candidatus Poribacteria bacterium]|nr:hypothetical protein [Candidatus Poribacteria bacterium]